MQLIFLDSSVRISDASAATKISFLGSEFRLFQSVASSSLIRVGDSLGSFE